MDRITPKRIQFLLDRICKLTNRANVGHLGQSKWNIGAIVLDHNSAYGGYHACVISAHGGESPLNSSRYSPREMDAFLQGILLGLEGNLVLPAQPTVNTEPDTDCDGLA